MVEIDALEIKITANTEEFDKKMKSISQTISELTKPIEQFTEKTTKNIDAISSKKVNIDTSEAKKSVQEMVDFMKNKYKDFGKDWEFVKGIESAKRNIGNYEQQLRNAQSTMNDLISSGDVYGKTFENAVKRVQTLQNKLEILKRISEESQQGIELNDINIHFMQNDDRDIKYYEDQYMEMKNLMETFDMSSQTFFGENIQFSIDELKSKFPEMQSLIKQYEDLYEEFISTYKPKERVGFDVSHIGEEERRIKEMISSLSESIIQLKNESMKLSSTLSKQKTQNVSKEYQELEKNILKTTNSLTKLQEKMLAGLTGKNASEFIETTKFQMLDEEIQDVSIHLDNLKTLLSSLGSKELNEVTTNAGKGTINFKQYINAFNGVIRGLDRVMGKLYNTIKKVISLIGRFGNIIVSPFRKMSNSIKSSTNQNDKLFKSLQKTYRMFRLMITRSILRGIIRLGTDGFKNVIKYSDECNKSFSLLWNSTRQLGNSAAAMVSPLLNALAPALNKIIQLAVNAANSINQVLSAFTGKSTWIRAKELTDDYVKSLDKANKQLAKFDELNNIKTNKEQTSAQDMFETVEIEQKWKELSEKIKKIVDTLLSTIKEAWNSVKDRFLNSANKMVKSLKELFKSIGSDFLEVWQQEKTIQIFEKIFSIIANIMDTVANLAEKFREAWEENERGKQILESIRDIVLIIVDNIEDLSENVRDWANTLNFAPLLEGFKNLLVAMQPMINALMKIVSNFISEVLLPLSKWTIEKGLPGLLDILSDLINKIDWDWIIDRLSEFNKHLEPFAETIGEGILLFIDTMKNKLVDWLNHGGYKKFDDWLKNIEDWMDNTSAQSICDELTKLFDTLIRVANALGEVAGWIIDKLAGDNLSETIENIGNLAIKFGVLWGAIKLFSGIGTIAAVVAPFFTIFASLKTAKALGTAGVVSAEGGVLGSVEAMSVGFTGLASSIKVLAAAIGGFWIGESFNRIITGEDINMNWIEQFEYIKSSFTDGSWKEALDIWGKDIYNAFLEIGNMQEQTVNDIKDKLFGGSEEISKELIDSVSNAGTEMSNVFSEQMQELQNQEKLSSEDIAKDFGTLGNSVENSISDSLDNALSDLESFSSKVKLIINSITKGISVLGSQIINKFSGFGIGIKGYATGGFPEDGWFRASKGELIGKFDDGTNVVANNEQIVKGIENGVYRAVKSAMSETSGGDVYLDGKVIFKSTQKYAREYEKSTGRAAF